MIRSHTKGCLFSIIRPSNGKIFSVTVRPAKIWTQANAMLLASPQRCDPRHFAIASYETNRKINFSVLLFLNMIVWNWFKLKKSWYFLWRVHKISTDTTFIVRFFSCKTCLTLILESWKKKSKTRDHHRACFAEKIQKWRSVTVPKIHG